ncbi:MAG: transposase, partial [Opitutaceae bacterium]|nr:transposase [Opitutaceae bacterium]
MIEKSTKKIGFSSAKGRAVEAAFDGGAVSSDGGLLLMREVDRKLGLIRDIARRL